MHVYFEQITDENRDLALNLKTAAGQEGFVEPVSQCLEEADKCRRWRPVGIYDGKDMVGFAMYGFFLWQYPPFGRLWLDRLLIDEKHQGRGYGSAALDGLVRRLIEEYRCRKIFLSVISENGNAIRMYQRFGFVFTGKKDLHGEAIMMYKVPDLQNSYQETIAK